MIVSMLVCDAFWVLFFWLGLGGPFSFFLFSQCLFVTHFEFHFFGLDLNPFSLFFFFAPFMPSASFNGVCQGS